MSDILIRENEYRSESSCVEGRSETSLRVDREPAEACSRAHRENRLCLQGKQEYSDQHRNLQRVGNFGPTQASREEEVRPPEYL